MKIKSIKIEINGEDKELTIEQARELRDVLDGVLETKEAAPQIPVVVPVYTYPYWSIYPPCTITCGDSVPVSTTTGIPTSGTFTGSTFMLNEKPQ